MRVHLYPVRIQEIYLLASQQAELREQVVRRRFVVVLGKYDLKLVLVSCAGAHAPESDPPLHYGHLFYERYADSRLCPVELLFRQMA